MAHPRAHAAVLIASTALSLAATAIGCTPPPAWTTTVSGLSPVVLSVWGTGQNDVWVVGGSEPATSPSDGGEAGADGGEAGPPGGVSLVLHFDGTTWKTLPAPTTSVLWWVFGFSDSDVWMCGEHGTVLHWDGNSFELKPSAAGDSTLFGIWGSSPSDIYAVGGLPDRSATAVHWDGSAFSPIPSAVALASTSFFKVWGSSKSDLWFAGQGATLLHFDGSDFKKADLSQTSIDPRDSIFTVTGSGPGDAYAVGGSSQGVALHYDGTAWSNVPSLDLSEAEQLTGVSESAAGDVCITGIGNKFRGHGSTWTDDSLVDPMVALHACWLDAPADIYAVGGDTFDLVNGVIAHYGQPVASTVK